MRGVRACFARRGVNDITAMERFINNKAPYPKLRGNLFPRNSPRQLRAALETGGKYGALETARIGKGVACNFGSPAQHQAARAAMKPLGAGKERDDNPALYRRTEFRMAEKFRNTLKEDA